MRIFYFSTWMFASFFLLMTSCSKGDRINKNEDPTHKDSTIQEDPTHKDSTIQDDEVSPLDSSFLIGIYVSPHTTDKDYLAVHEAHVDIIQDISEQASDSVQISRLKMAEKYGIKMIIASYRVNGDDKDIESMVDIFGKYPATFGYYVRDEPRLSELSEDALKYKKILSLDPHTWPHENLFANYVMRDNFGIKDYVKEYVENWIRLVGAKNLKYLSFDNYPYVPAYSGDDGTLYRWNDYFENLDVIRKLGLKYDIRTSTYLQSIGKIRSDGSGIRRPNSNELRFSAFSAIAYGITFPVWFTYWRPNSEFTPAIVDGDGSKTDLYQPFTKINFQMHQMGKILIKLKAIDVYHTGEAIPDNTSRPPEGFILSVTDKVHDSTIITNFHNTDNNKTYVMIVNKSLTQTKTMSFETEDDVTSIGKISKQTGEVKSTDYDSESHIFSDKFLPGEGNLYIIND